MVREISDFNNTPKGNRLHISFFGKRNAGKSSIVNAITGQSLSIVSPIKGTTTDPVSKAMELLPIGPVVIIDTPGIDDFGQIGDLRVEKTREILHKTDLAILVVDGSIGISKEDKHLLKQFVQMDIPYIIAINKSDLKKCKFSTESGIEDCISVSAVTGFGIEELKELMGIMAKPIKPLNSLLDHIISEDEIILLVTPIDSSAPKGRIILPQVQVIRNILDCQGICVITQVDQLKKCLGSLSDPPRLVVTDSQVFNQVKDIISLDTPLTSFSILFAHFKGILENSVKGARLLDSLDENASILISEGCTHHRQCEDIGTVKLPKWIENFTGKKFNFSFTSGGTFPADLSKFDFIVHCGGCMLNEKEMLYRLNNARKECIPFTNYGVLIAYMNGILDRSIEIFNK